jgi:glycosyltransferase involved in cell wall biosynthesis
MSVSVAIRSFNAGDRFDDVLRSLKGLADEIIVVDSGSTDRTALIAEKYGANVIFNKWQGFIAQANFAFNLCAKEWIFLLDQDEVVTDELKTKILEALKNPQYNGYEINRQTIYLGRRLKYAWQPDYIMRLARREKNAKCIGDEPHEVMTADGAIGRIKARLDHYSYANLREHYEKLVSYAAIGAQSYYKKGKTSSIVKIVFRPLFAFFKAFFVKRAFLDGAAGFLAARSSAIHVFLKYAMLYELQKGGDVSNTRV